MKKRIIIGKGSYGIVYRSDNIAIKRIDNLLNVDIIEPFLMGSLNHSNINSATEIKLTNKFVYLYQELATYDLSKCYSFNKLTRHQIDSWSLQMFNGLSYIHSYNIVHGDIKASNFLIFDNQIKLCDFTLSRFIDNTPELDLDIMTMNDIRDYQYLCTSTHRPPEIWFKYKCNLSTDVWGYGCVLFEMLFREHLFPYKYFSSKPEKIFPMLELFFKDKKEYSKKYNITDQWDSKDAYIDLIKKCLEYNPSKRLKTCREFKDINLYEHIKNKVKDDITVDKIVKNLYNKESDELNSKEINILKKINFNFNL